jgi:hypothetical protein
MPKPTPKQLSNIELDEVTVCEEPANDDCVAAIVKAKSTQETDMPHEQTDDELIDANDDTDDFDLDDETAAEVAAEIEALNEAGELVPAFAAMLAGLEEAGETITKMRAAFGELGDEHEELKKMSGALVAKFEKMKGGEDSEGADLVSVLKSSLGVANLDPAVERRIAAMEAVNKAAEDKDAIEKAKAFGIGKPDELAPVLTRIRKGRTNAADADYIEAVLKTAAATIKKSAAFRTIGSGGAADAGSAIGNAQAAAAEIRKSNPKLTQAQAMAEAFEQDPDLYAAHQAEFRAAARG